MQHVAIWLRDLILAEFPEVDENVYGRTKVANALYSIGSTDRVALGIQPGESYTEWADVLARLEGNTRALWSLSEMEGTGGDPDVTGRDEASGEYLFMDCAAESPKGRRSVCYDREALESRKNHKPEASAVELAEAMGATLIPEEEYRRLQELGEFDTKTSSWLLTPPDIRELGGAVFGDRRFRAVWIYHNGAESYYAARGFRCVLRV